MSPFLKEGFRVYGYVEKKQLIDYAISIGSIG
jgi:hypothetical protein